MQKCNYKTSLLSLHYGTWDVYPVAEPLNARPIIVQILLSRDFVMIDGYVGIPTLYMLPVCAMLPYNAWSISLVWHLTYDPCACTVPP